MIDRDTLNLDAMDVDELEDLQEELQEETTIPRPVRALLISYAEHKRKAMCHRMRGYIGAAREQEKYCDVIFNRLPVMYQW